MKKKNIILIGIVVIVVIICILGVIIGFGINDEPKDNDKDSVKLSQDLLGNDEDKESEGSSKDEKDETESADDESTEETTEDITKEATEQTTSEATSQETTSNQTEKEEVTTTSVQTEKEEETTTQAQTEKLDRWSYEYMIIDGKSVYAEYNTKIMEMYDSINKERISAGKSALIFDTEISYIACARASQVAYENVIEGSLEVKYYELMQKSGIVFSKAVENIAAGHESAKAVVSGNDTSWKTSTIHYDNMISDKYKKVGVGVDYSDNMGYVWVAIFSN